MSKHLVDRFEQALWQWEKSCFFPGVIFQFGSPEMKKKYDNIEFEGAIKNSTTLRSELLKTTKEFELANFLGNKATAEYLSESFWLPITLFMWNRGSRRIYEISDELQTLLSTISLKNVTWDDVVFPLQSFAIKFPQSISDGLGWESDFAFFGDATDFMNMVSKEKTERSLHFTLFSKKLEKENALSSIDKERFRIAVMRKNYSEMGKICDKCYPETEDDIVNQQAIRPAFINIPIGKNEPVENYFQKYIKTVKESDDDYQAYSVADKAIHLMIAMLLYIGSIKTSNQHRLITIRKNEAAKQQKSPDQKAIKDASELFSVSCENFISSEEKELLENIRLSRESGVKCVHWRGGYCRRMPGQGNNPDAPKVVIVKPAMVNADRLPINTLPSGSKFNLK